MKLKDILLITDIRMAVSIYDSRLEKVIYADRVDKLLIKVGSELNRDVLLINRSEVEDNCEIEFII